MHILGVKVDNLTKNQALKKIDSFLVSGNQHYITTPNPEIVLKAQKDDEFQDILNYADLAVADGFGLVLVSIFFFGWSGRIRERIRGVDLVEWFFARKVDTKTKFFLLGAAPGVADLAVQKIKEQYHNLLIVGSASGPQLDANGHPKNDKERKVNEEVIRKINQSGAEILLVAFGAPKQEKWIYYQLAQLPKVKLAIAVGGTLDFIAGKAKRAPRLMQNLGLEWFWRLIKEPWRISRIINATFIFLFQVFSWRIRKRLFYRANVCALIYQADKLLLVERLDEAGHWQMPQGGVRSGENAEQAIMREMKEELGTNKFEIKKIIPNVNKYIWPKSKQVKMDYPYRGQKQTLCILEFLGTDLDIKLDRHEFKKHQWVDKRDFIKIIHFYRKAIAEKALTEFDLMK